MLVPLVPQLTLDRIGLVLNWLFVAFSLALVAWLGWWDNIRLTAPVNRRELMYLLPFAAIVYLNPLTHYVAAIYLIQRYRKTPWTDPADSVN